MPIHFPFAKTTPLRTRDDLVIYDLEPNSSALWAIAGPVGIDPRYVNPDELPSSCRWLGADEWEDAQE